MIQIKNPEEFKYLIEINFNEFVIWYREWLDFFDTIYIYNIYYIHTPSHYFHSIFNIEQLVSEMFIRISIDFINLSFTFVTALLAFISVLSDHNHENEHTSLYKIIVFSTICLIICFTTNDLFWFYLGFKSITIPVYYLIHMYRSNIDKFKACDWYALFSFLSRAVLSFAVAILANHSRTTNLHLLINRFEYTESEFFTHKDMWGVHWVWDWSRHLGIHHYVYILLLIAFMIKSPVVPFHM